MILDGTIDLDAPADKAWDFLNDVNKFSGCLPGIDEIKQIDEKTFDGVISATVGPISGKFTFRSTILESRPPEQMVVRTEGADSVTRSAVQADMVMDLHRVAANKTAMRYRAEVKISGRLGILGSPDRPRLQEQRHESLHAVFVHVRQSLQRSPPPARGRGAG